jgi:pheromone shutdown protein TraB
MADSDGETAPGGADPPAADSLPRPSNDAGEGSVRVVGTAHVSAESVETVEREVAESDPDVVAVELDEGRYRQIQGETPEDLEAADLLRGNTVFQFLAYWMLSYVQTRLGERFDIEPGADMRAAVDSAEAAGAGVALVDRNIQVTIQRFWARMTLFEKLRMVSALAFGAAAPSSIAATVGVLGGVALGPPLGVVGFAAGVPGATAGRLLAAGLAGVAAGVLAWRGGALAVDEAFGGTLGVVAGPTVAVGVGLAGLGAGAVAGALSGVLLYLGAGAAVGAGVGLVVGVAVGAVLATGEDVDDVEEFDVEDFTDADVVTAMMEEFRRFSPGGAEALIDERDAYIAHNLVALRERGYDVLAVVGAGHRAGIEEYLDHPERLPAFEGLVGRESGSRFSVYKLFGYLFTLGFLGFFLLLVLGGASDAFLVKLVGAWFLFNGVFAFGLAKLAGARWTSAGVGGAVAWLTSVNPLLAPGWFAGYVELRYTTVNVSDIGRLNEILDDEESPMSELVDRLFDVPLFRLIMIVALTNVGSMVASFLFPFVVLPLVAPGGDVATVGNLMLEGARRGLDVLRGVLA